jgi:UDP-glucuronate 4-epimerase
VRVAVTGAAGFIGSHLCERLLDCGHAVVGVDNFDDFYEPARKWNNVMPLVARERFSIVEADVADRVALISALEGIDAVVHLAARAGVRPSFSMPETYVRANVAATATLLEVIAALDVPRLVFVSSSTVYGEGAQSPFREDGELGIPKSPYASTKVAGEQLCRAFAHRIPSLTILRLFSVYGPRQRPDLAIHKFARCIHAGEPIPVLGTTESFRDYTYVDDVVGGIAAAVELGEPWTVLNLGGGAPVTLEDMIASLEAALGASVPRQLLPAHPGDLFGTWADISAARSLLGFEPTWSFASGVRQFTDWFMMDEVNRMPARLAA